MRQSVDPGIIFSTQGFGNLIKISNRVSGHNFGAILTQDSESSNIGFYRPP